MNQTNPAPTGLTVQQAAELVGRTATDLRNAIAYGDIPFRQTIILAKSDVEQWAKADGADS